MTSISIGFVIFRYLTQGLPYLTQGLPYDSSQETISSISLLTEEEQLRQYAIWFIKIRWHAIFFWAIFILTCLVLHILPQDAFLPLVFCLCILIGLNLYSPRLLGKIKNTYRFIVYQMLANLFVLSGFLEFSGGIENPLYFLYLLHAIMAGVILFRGDAVRMTFFAWLLLCLVAMGQFLNVLPHHTIQVFPHARHNKKVVHAAYDTLFVTTQLGTFGVMMGVTVYFVSMLMNLLRESQKSLIHMAKKALSEAKEKEKVSSQLIYSSKMATIGELTGRIAHEVNNPIGIISAKVKLLLSDFRDGQLPDKVLSDLRKIDKHAERIGIITKGLLAFSRPSLGKKEPLDLHHVIHASLNLVSHQLASSGIKLQTILAERPLKLMGNFSEIQQVLLNIIVNAIDAMPHGGSLLIRTSQNLSGKEILVSITDTGTGIAPDILSSLFEPFITSKSKEKGTGLGLAICLGLVRSHKGRIEVSSVLGKGSTFTIFVPELEKLK
jgi:signal transduction histidine kinase